MSTVSLFDRAIFFVAPVIVMTAISIIFFATDKSSRVVLRLVCSAHGLLSAILFCSAIVIWQAGLSNRSLGLPYLCLFALPVTSIVLLFYFFRDNTKVYLFQILNVPCMFWTFFVGLMYITTSP